MPEHEIIIANICTWTNPGNLPEFNVSRTGGSPLGNPKYVAKDVTPEQRQEAIREYTRWLWALLREQKKERKGLQFNALGTIARAHQRGPVVLLCYCAPLSCHGEIVARGVRWFEREFLLTAYEGLPEEKEEPHDPYTVGGARYF